MPLASSAVVPPTTFGDPANARVGSIPFAAPGMHLRGLLLSAALLLLAFADGRIDRALARLAYDPASASFPLQHAWWLESLLHHGLKAFLLALLLATLGLCLLARDGRFPWLPPRRALGVALGLVLIPLLTTLLKDVTNRHCPWDIAEFGGYAPYVGLLSWPSPDVTRGACFPAGHAAGGYAWMILGFMLWDRHRRWAPRLLWGGLALGFLMGVGRLLQGAHFLSHVLWSAWLAWAICLALAVWLTRSDTPQGRSPHA